MAASLEAEALSSLKAARGARAILTAAQRDHEDAYLRFIRDSLSAGWSFYRIADAIGLSDTAVRRYWQRNRQHADRIPGA